MSIIARCEGCQKSYQVPDELAGKRKRCKACGHVVTIPAREAASPPIPADDDLIPLAPTTGAEPAPRPAVRLKTPPPLPHAGEPSSPPPMRAARQAPPAGAPVPAALGYGAPDAGQSAYVTLANEAVIDRYLPFVMVGLFVAFVVVLASQGVVRTLEAGQAIQAGSEAMSRGVGYVIGFAIGYAAGVAAIAAPLCLLGVFVASRVMKFPNRPYLYWRCLSAVCGPTALTGLVALALGATTPAAQVVSWVLLLPLLFTVLWFLLRLRPGPFAVTAGFVLLFAVLLPTAFYYGVIASGGPSRAGVAGARGIGGGVKRTDADVLREAIAKDREFKSSSGDRGASTRPNSAPGGLDSWEEMWRREGEVYVPRYEAELRQVAEALPKYAQSHNGEFPETWGELVDAGLLPRESFAEKLYFRFGVRPRQKYPALPAQVIFSRELRSFGKFVLMFGDGRVESVDVRTGERLIQDSERIKMGLPPTPTAR